MLNKTTALILSFALISPSAEGFILYAQENIQESNPIHLTETSNKEESNVSKQGIEATNVHKVYNTEELQDAIHNAKQGDIIKVYAGTYTENEITITKSNITIQGYSSDEHRISNYADAIETNTKFRIQGDHITLEGIEAKGIVVGYDGITNKVVANHTKIINSSVKGTIYIGDNMGQDVANNTLVEGCNISSRIKVNGSNTVIKSTKTTTIDVGADHTLVDQCDISFLKIGSSNKEVKNVKAQDTKISRFLELGKDNQVASDVTLERLDIYTAYIGYAAGTANNVSISDSRIDDCFMGTSNGGKTTHISIKNTDIGELSMGTYSGTSKNTKILNSNITQGLHIGENGGIAEDTYIAHSNISKKSDTFTSVSLGIGIAGGHAKNTKILSSNITGNIAIGDTNSASNPINTLIETNNPNVEDRGENTVVFNYLNEGLNQFKGQASQGLKIELVQEGTTLMSIVVDASKIVDTYLKEGDPNFSLAQGDKVLLNIYDANNNQLFSESMTIKELIVSLPKPKVNEVSNKSTHITGYVKADSQVFILKENQKENDKGVLVSRANSEGYFSIEVKGLKAGERLRIYSRDNSNNISEVLEIEVLDKSAPEFISVEQVTDKSSVIKGKVSKANISIEAVYQGQVIGGGISDNNGDFEVSIQEAELRGDQNIILTAYDASNNSSQYTIKIKASIGLNDIDGHWASQEIYHFIDKGYINGYEDYTFRPNNSITRAEFVKIVNGIYGFSEVGEIKFTDVAKEAWYAKEVAIAMKAGYINGKSDSIFDPNAPIKRQEAAKIIAVIKGCYDTDYNRLESFNDKDTVASWAMPYVEGVIEMGYMGGYSDHTFKPNQSITRAEAVVTLKRTLE